MKRNFLVQYLDKITNFPIWVKEIIYNKLAQDILPNSLSYTFTSYKPVLTYKGKCELDFKKAGFDLNIHNILISAGDNLSISEIMLNTYLSMEEVASYLIFCIEEGLLETPENPQILTLAELITDKIYTGEYFVKNGELTQNQCNEILTQQKSASNKKFGQYLIDLNIVSKSAIDALFTLKQCAKNRFVLDHNDIPQINGQNTCEKQIEDLQNENKQLRNKLEHLLTLVTDKND